MTIRLNIYITIGVIFFLLTWLFVGLFRDSEFYEPELFTKYRPTFKVFFYSPIGEGNLQLSELPEEKQHEETNFQDFVIKQHQQYNSSPRLWLLPFIFIQLTLTFLSFGFYNGRQPFIQNARQLAKHFFINLITTSICIGFSLSFDKLSITILFILLTLFINFWTTRLLTKQKTKLTT